MFDLHTCTAPQTRSCTEKKEEAERKKQNRKKGKKPNPGFAKERAAQVKMKAEEAKQKDEQLEKTVKEEGGKAERVKTSK
jgi:hypothetical protein